MKITNQKELEIAFKQIDALIAEGFEGNNDKEVEFLKIAKAIEEYENLVLKLMPIS
jgi:HTH-type transcriptional regulator / antitoxin HigA